MPFFKQIIAENRKYHLAVLVVLISILLSPALHGETGITYERSFVQDGFLRTYLLYVPASYTGKKAWPLVINYHGYQASAGSPPFGQVQVSQMNEAADRARFLVAYPQGLIVENFLIGNFGTGWNLMDPLLGAEQDDVAFTDSLIDHVAAEFNVDLARVHATGWSLGSSMAFYLACKIPHRIASVAGVANDLSYSGLDACDPGRPVSILQIFGTQDPIFPAEGSEYFPPIGGTASFFAATNDCSPDPVVTPFPDKVAEDNSTVTRLRYIRCDDRSQVLFYRINNGGHTWPGGGWLPPFLGNQNLDLDASSLILKFFKRNPHPWMHDESLSLL